MGINQFGRPSNGGHNERDETMPFKRVRRGLREWDEGLSVEHEEVCRSLADPAAALAQLTATPGRRPCKSTKTTTCATALCAQSPPRPTEAALQILCHRKVIVAVEQ
jgi:hypothetical protein